MAVKVRNAYEISFESLNGTDHSEYLPIDWRIILKRTLRKQYGKESSGLAWLRTSKNGRFFVNTVINNRVHKNGRTGQVTNYQLLKDYFREVGYLVRIRKETAMGSYSTVWNSPGGTEEEHRRSPG
jgi:hypothetical protein